MYKVSVIIPTFKSTNTLINAINSCLQQTYSNIEVIVVDDNFPNSTQRTLTEKVMEIYKEDNRIIYIKHEVNKNGSAARNTGIKHSTGYFIAFLDDDDSFYPTKIQSQVDFLRNNSSYQGVFTDVEIYGKIRRLKYKDDYSMDILLGKSTPSTSSLLFYKSSLISIGCFNESYIRHQDYELLLKFFEHYKLGKIDEVLVHIDTNGVNNIPDPQKMQKLKNKFHQDFAHIIEKLNQINPHFKKSVLISSNILISKLYFKNMNYISAAIMIVKCFRISIKLTFRFLFERFGF